MRACAFPTVSHVMPHHGYAQRLRFFLNTRLNAGVFTCWMACLEQSLPGAVFASFRLRMAPRIFRPYLRPDFGIRDRAGVLIAHYSFLRTRFPSSALLPMMAEPGVTLSAMTGKSGRSYIVTLGTGTTKEGEWSLSFIDREAGISLATLRIAIGSDGNGDQLLWIGGLQGAKPPWGREDIVRATRDLNGLRPKHAVLQASCVLSEWLGIHKMLAPGRSNHISQRSWRKWLPKRRIYADYDSFWVEFAAVRTRRGDYELRLPLPRRAPEDVRPKRRREWQRRYERLDALSGEIVTVLDSLALGGAGNITSPVSARP